MFAGELRGERVVDAGAAASRLAIDRDGNADARASYGHSALGVPRGNRSSEKRSVLRIIDAFRGIGPEVDDLVALLAQPSRELVLEGKPGMVGGKGDAHGHVLGDRWGIRQRPPLVDASQCSAETRRRWSNHA
jgi:hypothetical protein